MDEKQRGRRFQFDLQTLFWLTFAVAIVCLLMPVICGWWPELALGQRFKRGELNAPIITACSVFLVVRWLIRHDRP